MHPAPHLRLQLLLALALTLVAVPLLAQDDDDELDIGWHDTAEFSYVTIGGNAESETLSFRNKLVRVWESSLFELEAGALRAEQTTITRFAVVEPGGSPLVGENKISEITAEQYYLDGQYNHDISEHFFWFATAGWERNEFAGLRSRTTAGGGVGRVWIDREDHHFRTDAGLLLTWEEDLQGLDDEYLTLRLSYDYDRKLTESTTLESLLKVSENLEQTSDYRLDATEALAVAINERMSLRLSLQLLYDNRPSFVDVDLLLPDGTPTGASVPVELDELDTVLRIALVVDF